MNTHLPKTEENRAAAEKMLKDEIAKRTLELRRDALGINKLKYEDLRENLLTEFKRDKVASAYARADGSVSAMGLNWLDGYFTGMTVSRMADVLSKYPEHVQGLPEVKASWQERFDKEVELKTYRDKMPRKISEMDARNIADRARDASINRSLSTLRSMFSRFAGSFPKKMSKHDIPSMPRIQNADNVGQGFVRPEVYQAIYNEMPEHLRPLTQFLYITGMRSGAAQQLIWNMVEWEKIGGKQVAVAINVPKDYMKNKTAWSIPLAGPLAPIAETLGQGFRHAEMPLFSSRNFRREWNRVCGKLGLGIFDPQSQSYHGLHPHDFRRSAARNMIRAGVDKLTAMEITGHKSHRMFDRYDIKAVDDKRAALEQVGQYNT